MTKEDKKLVNDLDYDGIKFHVREKTLARLKQKATFKLVFPIHVLNQKFENSMDLLLVIRDVK